MKKLFHSYLFPSHNFFPPAAAFLSYFETHGKQTFRISYFHFTIAIIMQKNYSTSKERKWPRKTVEYEDEREKRELE